MTQDSRRSTATSVANLLPSQAALSRLGRVEFFACLPAGLYLFLIIPLFILSYLHWHEFKVIRYTDSQLESIVFDTERPEKNFGINYEKISINNPPTKYTLPAYHWVFVEWTVDRFQSHPLFLILSIFLAYLFGSFVRLQSLKNVETGILFGRIVYLGCNIANKDQDKFPFLAQIVNRIADAMPPLNKKIDKIFDFLMRQSQQDDDIIKFNVLKQHVCILWPHAFEYYQGFEARTRFLSGIYVAANIGFILSIIIIFFDIFILGSVLNSSDWRWHVNISCCFYFLFSLLLIIFVHIYIARIRRQEAEALLTLYFAGVSSSVFYTPTGESSERESGSKKSIIGRYLQRIFGTRE